MLERVTENQWTFASVSGGFGVNVNNWIRNRERLADVYRMLGRNSDAAAIEGQLLKLLAAAENGNAMRLRLVARSRAQNAPPVVTRSLVKR